MDYEAYARNTDPKESHEAAAKSTKGELEALVVRTLTEAGMPLTTKEMSRITGEPRDSLSPRMQPLVRKDLIQKTALRRDGAAAWGLVEG